MGFTCSRPLPGVYHIGDALGVHMTLLAGEERALLVDAGYGLHDVAAFVRTLTDRPVDVLLTHAHYDHALGARWFPRAYLDAADVPLLARYTGDGVRRRVLAQAKVASVAPVAGVLSASDEAGYLRAEMPPVLPPPEAFPLGGMTARVVRCPGHTPGSVAVFVPERALLLPGDAWNPCTWAFFPEALPVRAYRAHARALLALPFARVLCPHSPHPHPREAMAAALDALTDEALRAAPRVFIAPYEGIDTARAALPGGCELVFDRAKAAL